MLKSSQLRGHDNKHLHFTLNFKKTTLYQRIPQNLEKDTFKEKLILNQEDTTGGWRKDIH